MKRIVVSVTNDLTTDQRVHKVCTTLFNNGFDILLIGRKLKNSQPIVRDYNTLRMKLLFNKGALFYAEYNLRLFFILLFSKKDILLSNDLDTLLANYMASKISKSILVYDSHELFTEVPELINRPFAQNIWLKIEKIILPQLKNCYTVCDSISYNYTEKYGCNFKVIRNFPLKLKETKPTSFPFDTKNKKVILYQGALNKGRGLELIIETMLFIENSILVIIGSGDIEDFLKQKVSSLHLNNVIKFISKQNPEELKNFTPLANLGISIEEDLGLNYKYALPNKLFDYINAEIPVLVSNLPEMEQIIKTYDVGEIVTSRRPKKLAGQIEILLKKEKSYFQKNLEIAKNELIWENEEFKLIEIFSPLY